MVCWTVSVKPVLQDWPSWLYRKAGSQGWLVSQDRWSLVTGSVLLNCSLFYWESALMAIVLTSRQFYSCSKNLVSEWTLPWKTTCLERAYCVWQVNLGYCTFEYGIWNLQPPYLDRPYFCAHWSRLSGLTFLRDYKYIFYISIIEFPTINWEYRGPSILLPFKTTLIIMTKILNLIPSAYFLCNIQPLF